jgi:hypothetical protein
MLVIFTFLEAVAVISSRLFGMMARAHACSRRDWSADGSCGHCWQTALSRSALRNYPIGAVAELVGNEGGVVSGVFNLESSGVEASDWRPRHDEHYHEA